MALGHGAKIVTNGLVFAYDMGPNPGANKSWKGKPTTNEFVTGLLNGNYGGDGTLVNIPDAFNQLSPVYRKTGLIRFGNTGGADEGTLYVNNTYTFSVYMKLGPGNANTAGFEFDICDRANTLWVDGEIVTGNIRDYMTNDWRRFSVTALHNNSSAYHFIDIGIYQATNNEFDWCCPQIELGSFPTPYIPWSSTHQTRSNTEALLDWAGNNTITANSLTYNSDGTFSFASSLLDTTIGSGRNVASNPITIQAFVKSNTTSGARMWIDVTSNGTNQRLYSTLNAVGQSSGMGIQGSAWSSSVPIDTNWHYQAIVLDGSTATAYDNGVVASSKAYTSYTLPGNIIVGGRSGYYWSGEISAFSVYDRALTADEVKTNFNALRGRYGI